MARFKFPPPGRQVYVQAFLDRVRQESLHDAVKRATKQIPATALRAELTDFVPARGLQAVQGTGVRDELVFATPSMLRAAPSTLGYYRLLLGVSQKQFYTTKSGLNIFKTMEERGSIRSDAVPLIEQLCTELNEAMTVLVLSLAHQSFAQDVEQLPLLTLGAQADGSWRGQIGRKATLGVFQAMKQIVKDQGARFLETDVSITVTNSSGREVTLALAPDPDVVIREHVGNMDVYKTAIEIKGGADFSNIHNRVGEAEKSHQKARQTGAQQCWTIISLDRADLSVLRSESPSTNHWFDVGEVLKQRGATWDKLVTYTVAAMGI